MGANVYASTIGLPTSQWLHEKKKSLPQNANAFWRKSLSALSFTDRLITHAMRCAVARYHRFCGRVVILDRHVYDSWISKTPDTAGKRFRKRLFEGGFPVPDLVVLLDAPGEMLLKRKGEHTAEWLEGQRLAYLALKNRLPQMVVVDATQTLEQVQREVAALVAKRSNIRTQERTLLNGSDGARTR
jgi:thymidylate kinase